jgi:hypothetical protein
MTIWRNMWPSGRAPSALLTRVVGEIRYGRHSDHEWQKAG